MYKKLNVCLRTFYKFYSEGFCILKKKSTIIEKNKNKDDSFFSFLVQFNKKYPNKININEV